MRQRHKVKYRALPGDAPAGVGEPAGSSDSDPDEDSHDLEVGGRRGRRAKETKVRTTVFWKENSSN